MIKKQLTILFVDDEKEIRNAMYNALAPAVSKVYVASDGKEAKEIFDTHKIDVLISDINMPGTNGVELIESIRKETALLPIVVATGHSEMSVIYKNIYNIYVVLKPYDVETIIEIIEEAEYEIVTRSKCLDSIEKLESVKNDALSLLEEIRGSKCDIKEKDE